ncbi:MAG: hypothetical protein KDD60_12715, partial [Bdellovibrionales bacterium]|nr:hypothetical protein [Bdellovibrionales bacterium]
IGSQLRYPCETDTPGCLLCSFHHPGNGASASSEYTVGVSSPSLESAVHIRCRMRPFTSLFGSAFALLGGGGFSEGGPEITAVIHVNENVPLQ